MAKYKIGDKVKIREDLQDGKYYGGTYCNHDMAMNWVGKIVTITAGTADNDVYKIANDKYKYSWSVEMFDDNYFIPAENEDDEDNFEFAEKIITVQDFMDKFNTTTNTNIALYIRDKDYRVTMGCGDIEDSILYSTFIDAYGKFKVKSISFEYDYDARINIALLEVEP